MAILFTRRVLVRNRLKGCLRRYIFVFHFSVLLEMMSEIWGFESWFFSRFIREDISRQILFARNLWSNSWKETCVASFNDNKKKKKEKRNPFLPIQIIYSLGWHFIASSNDWMKKVMVMETFCTEFDLTSLPAQKQI